MPDDGVEKQGWIDRIATPLNACSLEAHAPVKYPPSSQAQEIPSNERPDGSFFVPVIIGCYQLNEADSGDGADSSAAGEVPDDGSEENGEGDTGNSKGSTRSGELRLHMIPVIGSSEPNDGVNSTTTRVGALDAMQPDDVSVSQTLRFGEPVHSVEMESGVLDGKWRNPWLLPFAVNSSDENAEDEGAVIGGGKNGSTQQNGENERRESSPLFASACASGNIHLHALEHGISDESSSSSDWRLTHVASSSDELSAEGSAICLALAWNQNDAAPSLSRYDANGMTICDQIVSSYSDGTVALHNVHYHHGLNEGDGTDGGKGSTTMEEIQRWNAHSLFGCPAEVWTCSFLTGVEHVVLSGADDCTLKLWDVRCTNKPTHAIGSAEFEAGVTAVSPHPEIPNLFAVGSYDEYVRVYDYRMMSAGPLWKVGVGGGVWRIKWHPPESSATSSCADGGGSERKCHAGTMLVAAMHGGCRVVNLPDLSATISEKVVAKKEAEIVSKFTAHESMAYGSDWIIGACSTTPGVAASCSFYDRQSFIWDSGL